MPNATPETGGEALRGSAVPVILVHPPVVRPCEAPAGIAKLAGALAHHHIPHEILDANVEGLLCLVHQAPVRNDTWTSVASRRLHENLKLLTGWKGYENFDRYQRAVLGVNRMLQDAAGTRGIRLSLANYTDPERTPLRSADLRNAWEHPETNLFYPYFRERLSGLLETHQPGVVGLSLNYLSQALCAFAMAGFLKKESPSLRVVLGGGLVTSWMSRPDWKNRFEGLVDLLVSGPGEAALLSLAGVTEPTGEGAPGYEGFPLQDYLAPGVILPYSASRGCYWRRCSFCPEKAERTPYLPISNDRVLREVERLVEKWNPVLIHFLDNAMSPGLLKALARHPPGAPWYGFARIGEDFTDPDYCEALKRSGCAMLKLGLESGDQAVLESLQKGIDLGIASEALGVLKKAGIATYVYLLFGTPAETSDAARRTLDFTARHSKEIDFLNLAVFNMPAYGPEARKFQVEDFYEGDLCLYRNFIHPGGWDRSAVRKFIDREFKRHPGIAAILRRDPPFFTSNHAPFFCAGTRGKGPLERRKTMSRTKGD